MKQREYPIYMSKKCTEEKHVDLLLTGEEGKRQYVLFKNFNTLMYDYTLHHGIKRFCCYCLQALSYQRNIKTLKIAKK